MAVHAMDPVDAAWYHMDGPANPAVVTALTLTKQRLDAQRLRQVLVNLLDNADRHGRGVVGLGVHRDGDTALVHVDDAGPGVPAEARTRIFERFATVARGRGSTAGTGLGLALVAQTLAAHHGAVWCTDRPGGGARFVVSLPLAAP